MLRKKRNLTESDKIAIIKQLNVVGAFEVQSVGRYVWSTPEHNATMARG